MHDDKQIISMKKTIIIPIYQLQLNSFHLETKIETSLPTQRNFESNMQWAYVSKALNTKRINEIKHEIQNAWN